MNLHRGIGSISMGLLLLLSSCVRETRPPEVFAKKPQKKSEFKESELKALFQKDLDSLAEASSEGLREYDQTHSWRFKQIFSGYSGPDLRAYFDARVKVAIAWDDEIQLTSRGGTNYTGWYDGIYPALKSVAAARGVEERDPDASKLLLAAANLGSAFWFQSLVNRSQLEVTIQDAVYPVHSSRVGIIALGPGYRGSGPARQTLRHGTLMHEARHSDCPGGITDIELEPVRASRNAREFESQYRRRDCMHFHTRCPSGHDLEGVSACDGHAWGSYSVDAIYFSARRNNPSLSFQEKMLLDAHIVDSRSRILSDFDQMIRGRFGDPDMSHRGFY